MNPGRYREIVEFYNPERVGTTSMGEPEKDPYNVAGTSPDATRHAKVSSGGGNSQFQGGSEDSQQRIEVEVRPGSLTITERTRIVWRNQEYAVQTFERVGPKKRRMRINAVLDE